MGRAGVGDGGWPLDVSGYNSRRPPSCTPSRSLCGGRAADTSQPQATDRPGQI